MSRSRLAARLVEELGAGTDEAVRIANELDPSTARAIDEDAGRLGGLRNSLRSGDDAAGLAPQSSIGRLGAGAGTIGVGALGVSAFSDRQERLAAEAAADETEDQAEVFREILENEDFGPQEEAEVLSSLAGSGFAESGVSTGEEQGDGGGLIPDNPIMLAVAAIILLYLAKYVLEEDDGGGGTDGT